VVRRALLVVFASIIVLPAVPSHSAPLLLASKEGTTKGVSRYTGPAPTGMAFGFGYFDLSGPVVTEACIGCEDVLPLRYSSGEDRWSGKWRVSFTGAAIVPVTDRLLDGTNEMLWMFAWFKYPAAPEWFQGGSGSLEHQFFGAPIPTDWVIDRVILKAEATYQLGPIAIEGKRSERWEIWGTGTPIPAPVPEPSALMLTSAALTAVWLGRRRR
jgi:hypothetical protein